MKHKPGDKFILINCKNISIPNQYEGAEVEVVEVGMDFNKIIIPKLDEYLYHWNAPDNNLIPLEIWNSPVYKLLRSHD